VTTATHEVLDGFDSAKYWTTVNAREAWPGVMTPLNWSFYGETAEQVLRGTFHALGALRTQEFPTEVDKRFTSVFNGHAAFNVDVWRSVADATPGNSGDALERQFFGNVRPGVHSDPTRSRYAAMAAKYPKVALTVRKEVQRHRRETFLWWRQSIAAIEAGGLDVAKAKLREGPPKFVEVGIPHTVCSMIAQGLYQQIAVVAEKAGHPGLESSLATGYGSEETAALQKLWEISRGHSTECLADVVADHGFTAPGELSAHSWREDPDAVQAMVERYRALSDGRSPSASIAAQQTTRAAARTTLFAALSPIGRLKAMLLLVAASRTIPAREYGRAAILMAVDVSRAAARRAGALYVAEGLLDDPDDPFFLTIDEICALPADARAIVARRRERDSWYRSLVLPEAWTGRPEAIVEDPATTDSRTEVRGVGVSPGQVTGTARVVEDPLNADDFADGEILVCEATDPAWASLFLSAGAAVIDIGGPMSHGAIVARELGLPCVINTKDGTRRIRTGDSVLVDGNAGTVTITRSDT
jgi:pyruvate,water dikinase